MIRRDYTKEIGAGTRTNTLPWPMTLLVLAILALGAGWLISNQSRGQAQPPRAEGAPAPAHPARPG